MRMRECRQVCSPGYAMQCCVRSWLSQINPWAQHAFLSQGPSVRFRTYCAVDVKRLMAASEEIDGLVWVDKRPSLTGHSSCLTAAFYAGSEPDQGNAVLQAAATLQRRRAALI